MPDPDREPEAELEDIVTNEVSAVDAAANGKRFIVVKAEENDVPKAKTEEEKGGGATTEEDAEKRAKEDAEKAATAHETLLAEKLAALKKGADKIAAAVGAGSISDAKELIRSLTEVAWGLSDSFGIVKLSKAAADTKGVAEVLDAVKAKLDDAEKAKLDEDTEKAKRDAEEKAKLDEEEAEAEGKPGSAFLAKLSSIDGHLAALVSATKKRDEEEKARRDDDAEKAKRDDEEKSKRDDEEKARRDADAEKVKRDAEKAKRDEALDGIAKAMKALGSRVASVEKSTTGPRSVPPGGGGARADDPEWPMDMGAGE